MENYVLCRVSSGETIFNFIVGENYGFEKLKDTIRQRFRLCEFEMSASFPGHHTSMLDCDLDVRLLVQFAKLFKCDYVDINVTDVSDASKSSGSKESSSLATSSSTNASVTVGNRSELDDQVLDVNECEAYGRFLPSSGVTFMTTVWKSYIQSEGQLFLGGVDEFRDKLRKYCIESGFILKMERNTINRVTGRCLNECATGKCTWKVHAIKVADSNIFRIKSLSNVHSCTGRIRANRSSLVNSSVIASIISSKVKLNQNLAPKDIIRDVYIDYGLKIDYNLAWYSREKARALINGNEVAAYSKLNWYIDSLRSTNPGSHCVLECENSTFRRLFISYGACIEGFQYCRPLLFIDATHIKSKFKGVLLCATGKNANQGFYPFAFAIASAENQENWLWFFERLREVLHPSDRVINFISDRNEGLIKGIRYVFPNANHAFCYYHLTLNLKSRLPASYPKHLRDKILKRFMKLTYTPTEESYYYHLEKLLQLGGKNIANFMHRLPKEHFSNAFFKGSRYGNVSNGVAESFNSWILELRHLQIYEMIDGIRMKLMEQFANRKSESENWTTTLCPEVIVQLNKLLNIGGQWSISRSSEFVFEVVENYTVRVDLESRSCSCGMWRIKRFPCAHALVAIQQNRGNFCDYIEDHLKTSYFRASYAIPIEPIPDIDKDFEDREDIGIMPPHTSVPPGRPKTKRIPSQGESSSKKYKCSRCNGIGHNRSGCTAAI